MRSISDGNTLKIATWRASVSVGSVPWMRFSTFSTLGIPARYDVSGRLPAWGLGRFCPGVRACTGKLQTERKMGKNKRMSVDIRAKRTRAFVDRRCGDIATSSDNTSRDSRRVYVGGDRLSAPAT